jgi:hypothetical protein
MPSKNQIKSGLARKVRIALFGRTGDDSATDKAIFLTRVKKCVLSLSAGEEWQFLANSSSNQGVARSQYNKRRFSGNSYGGANLGKVRFTYRRFKSNHHKKKREMRRRKSKSASRTRGFCLMDYIEIHASTYEMFKSQIAEGGNMKKIYSPTITATVVLALSAAFSFSSPAIAQVS